MTPRIQIFALVGLAGITALALGVIVLGRTQPVSEAATPIPLQPLRTVKSGAAAGAEAAAPTPARKAPRKRPPLAPNGLPWSIADALERHGVVVVSLYAPGVEVDQMASAEAGAGAELADAGFVKVNVLSQQQIRPLAEKLGVLKDPSVLVFRRSGEVFVRIDGFVDRETVAQAAANASS